MRQNLLKTAMLALAAALMLGGLPLVAPQSSEGNQASAEAQTRRTRRPAVTTLVPVGTGLRIRLNNDLSSKDSRVGDRFTATVLSPSRFEEATVTGHVSSIKKSGRVQGRTSMSLAFDSIQLTNGRKGVLRGEVIRIYESGSESASKVDEEGRVESGSRGNQTLKRGGIGAAAGAILGGIVGGGKGAAIGLIVGGAAGAGSVAIDGSKELKLESGTEMLVRVTRR